MNIIAEGDYVTIKHKRKHRLKKPQKLGLVLDLNVTSTLIRIKWACSGNVRLVKLAWVRKVEPESLI